MAYRALCLPACPLPGGVVCGTHPTKQCGTATRAGGQQESRTLHGLKQRPLCTSKRSGVLHLVCAASTPLRGAAWAPARVWEVRRGWLKELAHLPEAQKLRSHRLLRQQTMCLHTGGRIPPATRRPRARRSVRPRMTDGLRLTTVEERAGGKGRRVDGTMMTPLRTSSPLHQQHATSGCCSCHAGRRRSAPPKAKARRTAGRCTGKGRQGRCTGKGGGRCAEGDRPEAPSSPKQHCPRTFPRCLCALEDCSSCWQCSAIAIRRACARWGVQNSNRNPTGPCQARCATLPRGLPPPRLVTSSLPFCHEPVPSPCPWLRHVAAARGAQRGRSEACGCMYCCRAGQRR